MARFFAVLAAVAMVAGAVALRDRVASGGSTAGQAEAGAERLRQLCDAAAATACHDLGDAGRVDVDVESPLASVDRLAAAGPADLRLDGWLVAAPWAQMLEEQRARSGAVAVFDEPTPPVARSPLLVAVWAEREEALAGACAGRLGWRCLGDVAGRAWQDVGGRVEWGPVKPGHLPPSTTAGLVTLGQVVSSYFGRSDVSARDLADDGFRSWFTRLERAVPSFEPPAGDPLAQALQIGPAAYDAVAALEASAAPLLARSAARRGSLQVRYLEPVVTADLVFVPRAGAGRRAAELGDVVAGRDMAALLAAQGWRVEGEAAAGVPADAPALPPGSALPSAGLLEAVRLLWQEVTG